jgi:pimeloyl-ACP methyl ester carboxylesterase
VALLLAGVLLLLMVGPFFVPVPELTDTVPARSLAQEPSQFLTLPFPGTGGLADGGLVEGGQADGGMEIHYWIDGDGPRNFLLLHGFALNLYTWDETFDFFAAQGRTLAYDRIPFGLSARPLPGDWPGENPYSRAATVEQAIGMMDALGMERAILVGNSAGGSLAMQIALAHPERVEGLILAAPAVFTGNGSPPLVQALANTPQMQRLGPLLARAIGSVEFSGELTPAQLAQASIGARVTDWDRALWAYTAATNRLDLSPRFPELTMPTLLLTGDADSFIPPAETMGLADSLPNATLVVIPGCGHLPQQECETEFMQAVGEWLASLP